MDAPGGEVVTSLSSCSIRGADGVTLQAIEAGRGQPRRAVYLHGFPEGAFVWEPLLEALAGELHGLAPSLRGYAPSSAPSEVARYKPRHLVADLQAMIEQLGAPLDLLVAHDWGGAVAWNLAATRPHLLRHLLIINSPHPATFLRELRFSEAQQAASEYMLWLREPGAEERLAADDFAALWALFGDAHWLTPSLRDRYRAQWAAGLTGALNLYRASPLHPPLGPEDPLHQLVLPRDVVTVRVPTTVLWGDQDRALLPGLLEGLDAYVPDLRLVRVPDASHWLVHECPERVVSEVRRALGL